MKHCEVSFHNFRQNFIRGKVGLKPILVFFDLCRLQSIRPSLDQMLAALSSQTQQQADVVSAMSGIDLPDWTARQFEAASILLQGQTAFLTSLRQPLVLVLQVRAAIPSRCLDSLKLRSRAFKLFMCNCMLYYFHALPLDLILSHILYLYLFPAWWRGMMYT